MMRKPSAFSKPIYITKPSLPALGSLSAGLKILWKSRRLTNDGPFVQELEKKLQFVLDAPNARVFSNGTLALMLACKSLNLTGEVITTPFTFPATLHALTWNGLKPVFCDIRPDDFTLNATLISNLITPATSAIMPVHVFGNIGEYEQIEQIAKQYNLKVIYDAAHAFGVSVNGRSVATLGDMNMFSLHATKPFHTIEGGILTYNNENADHILRLLRNFGLQNEEEVVLPGINAKLNEFQALIGLLLLEELESQREHRAQLIAIYAQRLGNLQGVRFIHTSPHISSNYAYAVIQMDAEKAGMNRDDLQFQLKNYHVFSRKYFYPPGNQYPHYRTLPSSQPDHLPVTEKTVGDLLTLPLYNDLASHTVMQICDIIEYLLFSNSKRNVFDL